MARFNEQVSEMKDLPENLLNSIIHYITGFHNSSGREINELILKPGLSNFYKLFIIQYGLLSVCGIVSNIFVIGYILRYKLYRDVTQAFILNLGLCHFIQSAFVLPVTCLLILSQNWIFGQFLCYFIPLLQVSILCGAVFFFYYYENRKRSGGNMQLRIRNAKCYFVESSMYPSEFQIQ